MDINAQIIKRLITKNYYLARVASHIWFKASFDGKRLLVVYQMGKVGSSTVVESLKASDLQMPVLQVHFLSPSAISEVERRYYGNRRGILQSSLWPETKHLFLSYYLRSNLASNRPKQDWKIVTLVREPLARSASVFFYSVDTPKQNPYIPDFYAQYSANTISTEMLVKRFLEVLFEDAEEFLLPLSYFDTEFKAVTGIDVYASNFPKDRGYEIYHGDGVDVLLIRLESMQACSREAFREFLGLKDLPLKSTNLASQKLYHQAYKEFLRSVRIPRGYLDKVYGSKYVRQFYTENEIESFWLRWGK